MHRSGPSEEDFNPYSATLEALPYAMYMIDPEGKVVVTNQAFRTVVSALGRQPNEPLHTQFDDFQFWDMEGDPIPPEEMPARYVLRTGQSVQMQVEVRIDGSPGRYALIAGGPVRNASGEMAGALMSVFDITEQKKIERELREHTERLAFAQAALAASEQRYRMLAETIPVGVAIGHVYGPQHGLITFANRTFLDTTGYTREDIASDRVRWTDMTPVEWRGADAEAFRNMKHAGASGAYEKEVFRRDGTRVPVEVAFANFGSGGSEVVAVLREISQQKRMEDELRLREAEKNAIFNALPAGVSVVANSPERWREGNPAWLSIQGFENLEEMRMSVARGEHTLHYASSGEPIPADQWPSSITLRTGESVSSMEIVIHGYDGRVVPALCSSAPVLGPNGEVRAAVVSIVEITEQKRVEESLRQRENERAAMLHALPTGFCIFDADLRIVEANQIWVEMSGFANLDELKDVLERTPELIRRHTPEGAIAPPELWPSALCVRTRSTVRDVELMGERVDTGHRWVALYSAAPVTDSTGRVTRVVVTAQDITRLKRAEDTLKLRTEQLASSNEELQAFAYTASHDLQEPLRTVALYSELLDRRCPVPEGPCGDYRKTIRANAIRMQDMLKSLLTYSQLSQTDRPKSAMDVSRVLEAVIRSLESSVRPGDEIVFSGMPVVQAWEGRLEQVFQNLIGNSLKYRKPGMPVYVSVTCSSEGSSWLFQVRDNGIGFRMDYAERIFGIFKRLHGRDEYGGTGIGLTIVRRIVERHAGRIWAESREGDGSSFYFTLPKWG